MNGLKFGNGGDGSGASYLICNSQKGGAGGFGLKFIGDGPARHFCGEAQFFLVSKRIHFDHYAVGIVTQIMSCLIPMLQIAKNLFYISAVFAVFCRFYSPLMRILKRIAVGLERIGIGQEMV